MNLGSLTRPVPHIVTMRFPSPDMEARFKFQPNGKARRGREQAQHDLREWWRSEILLPAARLCYRAMQPEYQIEGNLHPEYWLHSKRMCEHATRQCWAYFDGGFVTIQMEIFSQEIELVARREMQHLSAAIDAMLDLELASIEMETVARGKNPEWQPDNYDVWRERVYRDIQRAFMDDIFKDGVMSVIPRSHAHILAHNEKGD